MRQIKIIIIIIRFPTIISFFHNYSIREMELKGNLWYLFIETLKKLKKSYITQKVDSIGFLRVFVAKYFISLLKSVEEICENKIN